MNAAGQGVPAGFEYPAARERGIPIASTWFAGLRARAARTI